MPPPSAPIPLAPTSITPAQPSFPSVTSATATASAPSSSAAATDCPSSSSTPASLFSSLLSTTSPTTRAPKSKLNPPTAVSSPPSVSASSVSVSVSTTHHPPPSSTARTSPPPPLPATTATAPSLHLQPQPQQPSAPHRAAGDQVTQARAAVVASIGNLLDRELTSRAAQLHANNAAIERQEREVVRATEALRKENNKLGKLAEVHARKVKEIGNVQNWAEMLEREFLILEETLRLVNGGSEGDSERGSGSEMEEGESGSEVEGEEYEDGDGDVVMWDGPETVPLPESPPSGDGWAGGAQG